MAQPNKFEEILDQILEALDKDDSEETAVAEPATAPPKEKPKTEPAKPTTPEKPDPFKPTKPAVIPKPKAYK